MQAADVVIVGAGPVGLTLALGLAKSGCRVCVLEQEPCTKQGSRAITLWPPAQQILAELGVLPGFLARGKVLKQITLHDADRGQQLLGLPLAELSEETPYAQLLVLPQAETERLLAEAVSREPSAEIMFSTEATMIESRATEVRVEFSGPGPEQMGSVTAPFAAGCDGAHSTVREFIGARLEGKTYQARIALADIVIGGTRDLPFPRISTKDGLAIAIQIDDCIWRLILPFPSAGHTTLDTRVRNATRALFPTGTRQTDEREQTLWQSEFRLHRRVSSRFTDGRVVLAGDAAHLNSPLGGQGMNAGIQDAEALTKALMAALDRDNTRALELYEQRRRAAIVRGVNPFTDRATKLLLSSGGDWIRPVLYLVNASLRVPALRRKLLRKVTMLDPHS